MTESSFKTSSSNYQELEKGKICNSKILPKFELKSSIPRPTPYIRNKGPLTSVSTYMCHTQSVCRIPKAIQPTRRGKTSLSLQARPCSASNKDSAGLRSRLLTARSQSPKPNTPNATSRKNPYSNVKAKVDTKLNMKSTTKLQSQFSPTRVHFSKSNISSVASSRMHSFADPAHEQSEVEKPSNSEELLEKQRQLLAIFNELKQAQPTRDLQQLEKEICRLMRRKTISGVEDGVSSSNPPLLSEEMPDFLSAFESQMHDLLKSWYCLICELLNIKLMVGGSTILSRLSLPDPSLDLREEMFRFLSSLPTEGCNLHPSITSGEPLHMKLQKIEEDHHVMSSRVMHSVLAQTKELKDLKDKYTRLEKTQDQIHFKMKEEMAILGNENKDLDRKYTVAVEKYNMEKTKSENLEKQKLLINKEIVEIKMMIKVMEGKCAEYEAKVRKAEATVRSLETVIRNKDVSSELEGKQHRELVSKFNELKDTINRLKSELAESNDLRSTLERENSHLQSELSSSKAALDESVKKRNELVEELSNKTKKMNEAGVQLELMKTYTANNHINRDVRADMEDSVMKADLSTEIRRKDLEIEELRRRKDLEIEELRRHIASMEHLLKEKTTLEDHLRKQVADLNKQQPHEVEVTLRAQIRDLQYAVKDLTEERAGLEKIIAQKTLELDQRDLLLQQHSQILRSRDELIPLIQNRKRYDQECLERLRGFVFEHEKTYFNKEMDNRFNNDQYVYESANAVDKPYAFDPTMVDKEMSFRQEKMTELFNLLEQKQMEMMRLERRMRDLQGAQDQREKTVREQAACISSLQKALGGPNTNKSRGFFSLLSGQDSHNY